MKKFLLPTLMLVLGACASDPLQFDNEPTPSSASAQIHATLGEAFRLGPGQFARVADSDLLVAFHSVESDSRCAAGTTCVWAGDAGLYIGTATEGSRWSWSILHTGIDPRTRRNGAYTISVEGLEPDNRAGVPIPTASYAVLLKVVRG